MTLQTLWNIKSGSFGLMTKTLGYSLYACVSKFQISYMSIYFKKLDVGIYNRPIKCHTFNVQTFICYPYKTSMCKTDIILK